MIGADRLLPCDMTRVVAKGVDFSDADLNHAIMVFADISRANFTERHAETGRPLEARTAPARAGWRSPRSPRARTRIRWARRSRARPSGGS